MDFPIDSMVIFHSYVKLPEGSQGDLLKIPMFLGLKSFPTLQAVCAQPYLDLRRHFPLASAGAWEVS